MVLMRLGHVGRVGGVPAADVAPDMGRDPLPDDRLALRSWVDSGFTFDAIRQALMASDEYRQRHPVG